MRRYELLENAKNIFRFPSTEAETRRKEVKKVLPPLKPDTSPGPVRIYTREELIQWPAL